MNKPQISIVIPIYKAEVFLPKCLDSVLAQTNTEWECLLIDDGSPDGSRAICQEYVDRDSRFRVFHKENGGVSSARNLGLDNAKGEWITFLDADDAIEGGFLDIKKEETGFDLIIGNEKRNEDAIPDFAPEDGIYEGIDLKHFFEQTLVCHILRSPWGKFFYRDLIGSLRFDESLHFGEDTLFCFQYYQRCSKIIVDTARVYLYTISDCSSKYQLTVDYALHTFHLLYDSYEKLGCICNRYNRFIYYMFCVQMSDSKSSLQRWYSDKCVRKFYMKYIADSISSRLLFYRLWIRSYF